MRNLVLLIIGIIILGSTAARAHDVLVIQSLRVKPFEEAYRGFRKACDGDVRRIYLPDMEKSDIARTIRDERPRLILAIGSKALERVRNVKEIPVLYLMVLNPPPAGSGNRNITGVAMNVPPEKYFEILARITPASKRVGVVYDPARSGPLVKRSQQAAQARGIELVAMEARKSNEVPKALDALKGSIDALLMLPDTTVVTPDMVESFLIFSQNNSIPIITFASKYVDMGALLSLNIDVFDQGIQAGEMARQILEGAVVSALPGMEARKLHIKANRNVAKKLGISLDNLDGK